MPEQTILKTAVFGGFEKDGVLKYIDSMSAQHAAAEEESNKYIAEKEAALAQTKADLSEKERELGELTEVCDEMRTRYLELKSSAEVTRETAQQAQKELRETRAQKEKLETELAILGEQNRLLIEEAERRRNEVEELRSQSGRWEAAAERAGKATDAILAEAEAGAGSLTEEAEKAAIEVNSGIDELRTELAQLKDYAAKAMGELTRRMEQMDSNAEKAKIPVERCEVCREDIGRRCAQLRQSARDELEAAKGSFFR